MAIELGHPRFAPRESPLPGGGSVVAREAEPRDVDGLLALFAALDLEDQHRRFFSAHRPSKAEVDRLVDRPRTGGCTLVAVHVTPDGDRIVAEADYALLANGDGELGITIADGWRGWLGPWLLGALLEVAASRGVPNLEADVLVTNTPMLALARARGCATIDQRDFSIVRLLVGTGPDGPTWPPTGEGTRVLVEGPSHWHADDPRVARLRVLACPGPQVLRGRCPALHGERCALAEGADAIVVRQPEDPTWAAIVEAHRDLHPGVPVCVVSPPAGHEAEPGTGETDIVGIVQRYARHREATGPQAG